MNSRLYEVYYKPTRLGIKYIAFLVGETPLEYRYGYKAGKGFKYFCSKYAYSEEDAIA